MADPISVTGTAVGVASLGIQVCQGLLQYYTSWKGYKQDITTTYECIENFERTLLLLGRAIDQTKPSPDVLQQVAKCIIACTGGIERLKRKFEKIKENTPGDSVLKSVRFFLLTATYICSLICESPFCNQLI